MARCIHRMEPGTCDWCHKRRHVVDVTEGMWIWALQDDPVLPPQVTATIVPVPSTARLPKRGTGGQLPRSDKPRHEVLTERPSDPDETRRLFERLAQARPEWVRS